MFLSITIGNLLLAGVLAAAGSSWQPKETPGVRTKSKKGGARSSS